MKLERNFGDMLQMRTDMHKIKYQARNERKGKTKKREKNEEKEEKNEVRK